MKFGLTNEQYKILEEIVFKPLRAFHTELYVFGSRARNNHHPFSDIDILYKEKPEFPVPDSLIGQIREKLENSNLPFKVDLANEQNLAKSYHNSIKRDLKKI